MVLPLTTTQLKFLITWKKTSNYPYRTLVEIYHISSVQFPCTETLITEKNFEVILNPFFSVVEQDSLH